MCSVSAWFRVPIGLLLPGVLSAQSGIILLDTAWMPARIEQLPDSADAFDGRGTLLTLRNGRQVLARLFDVRFLGHLPRSERAPFLIVAARGCQYCDITTNIFAIPADEGTVNTDVGYAYPGTISAVDDSVPFYRARMFLGRCLPDHPPSALWFQAQRDSTGAWVEGVYRLSVASGQLRGEFLDPRPRLSMLLNSVRRGVCIEIRGRDQVQL